MRAHRRILACVAGIGILAAISGAEEHTGKGPVDFDTVNLAGERFELSSLRGEIVVLDFWAVWCAPCLAAIPALNEIHAARETSGAHVVGVAMYSGGPDKVRKLLKKHDSRYTKIMGSEELGEEFGVIGYPTYFLIGPKGRIRGKYIGKIEEELRRLRKDIAELRGSIEAKEGG